MLMNRFFSRLAASAPALVNASGLVSGISYQNITHQSHTVITTDTPWEDTCWLFFSRPTSIQFHKFTRKAYTTIRFELSTTSKRIPHPGF